MHALKYKFLLFCLIVLLKVESETKDLSSKGYFLKGQWHCLYSYISFSHTNALSCSFGSLFVHSWNTSQPSATAFKLHLNKSGCLNKQIAYFIPQWNLSNLAYTSNVLLQQ